MLLISATAISTASFLLHVPAVDHPLGLALIFAYIPLLFGSVAMLLCVLALLKSKRKSLVLVYTVVLAPFAFSYPAWIIILWVLYTSGGYKGPMP